MSRKPQKPTESQPSQPEATEQTHQPETLPTIPASQPEAETTSKNYSPTEAETKPANFNAALDPEPEPLRDEEGREVEPEPAPKEISFMSREAFRNMFIGMMDFPADIKPEIYGPLAIPKEDTEDFLESLEHRGACVLADKIFDKCATRDAPKWMQKIVSDEDSTVMDYVALSVFAAGRVSAIGQVRANIQRGAPKPANSPEAPTDAAA